MSFNPRDFLKLANKLKERENQFDLYESALRTVVGRAYYAAFLEARSHALSKNYIELKNNVHQKLAEFFDDSSENMLLLPKEKNNLREISSKLRRLFFNRVQADYHLTLKNNVNIYNLSRDALLLSNKILSLLDSLKSTKNISHS